MSSYRKHAALFAGKWAAQQAKADPWKNNLTLDGVGVVQPDQRVTGDVCAIGIAGRDESLLSGAMDASHAGSIPAVTPSKYHNVQTGAYASKREAKRAAVLRLLQDTKVISDLREQVAYVLIPRQLAEDGSVAERAVSYIADFVYRDNTTGLEVVEDCKGMRTPEYVIKRKLMRFTHGVVIKET